MRTDVLYVVCLLDCSSCDWKLQLDVTTQLVRRTGKLRVKRKRSSE
jgi:hypothetical protein